MKLEGSDFNLKRTSGYILLGNRALCFAVVRKEEGTALCKHLQPAVQRDRGDSGACSAPCTSALGKVLLSILLAFTIVLFIFPCTQFHGHGAGDRGALLCALGQSGGGAGHQRTYRP